MNDEYVGTINSQKLAAEILFVETFFKEPFFQIGHSIHSKLSLSS